MTLAENKGSESNVILFLNSHDKPQRGMRSKHIHFMIYPELHLQVL